MIRDERCQKKPKERKANMHLIECCSIKMEYIESIVD